MEDKIILTVEEVGVWAFEKFAQQEKVMKNLTKANKRLAFAVFCLSVAGYFAGREIEKLHAEIDALKPAGE